MPPLRYDPGNVSCLKVRRSEREVSDAVHYCHNGNEILPVLVNFVQSGGHFLHGFSMPSWVDLPELFQGYYGNQSGPPT
jgi:hypothetical protein